MKLKDFKETAKKFINIETLKNSKKNFKDATKKQKLILLGTITSLGVIVLGVGLGVGLSGTSETVSEVINNNEGTYWRVTSENDSTKQLKVLRIKKEVTTEVQLGEAYTELLSKGFDLANFNELLLPYHFKKNKVTEEKVKEVLHMDTFNNKNIRYVFNKEDYDESKATDSTASSEGYKNKKLVEINLPNDIENLPNSAFTSNYIRKVNWSELTKLKSIGDQAFFLNKLTGDLDLSGLTALESIGKFAFVTNKLNGTLTLPPNITTIGKGSFNSDTNSQNKIKGTLKLPKSLKSIGDLAFILNEIEVLDWSEAENLVDIKFKAFANNKLEALDFKDSLKKLKEIGPFAFLNNPGKNRSGKLILESITLPPSLVTIGSNAIKVQDRITIKASPKATGINDDSFDGVSITIDKS